MTATHTIWICSTCVKQLNEAVIPAAAGESQLERLEAGALVTIGFRDVEDHHTDCDLRVSVSCGDHGYDCNVSCEQWDDCPFDCHGCGAESGERTAATVWPALAPAL